MTTSEQSDFEAAILEALEPRREALQAYPHVLAMGLGKEAGYVVSLYVDDISQESREQLAKMIPGVIDVRLRDGQRMSLPVQIETLGGNSDG